MSKAKIHLKTENIELLWHELKTFSHCIVKPTNKDKLVVGIHQFWDSVTAAKCCISHLQKVFLL